PRHGQAAVGANQTVAEKEFIGVGQIGEFHIVAGYGVPQVSHGHETALDDQVKQLLDQLAARYALGIILRFQIDPVERLHKQGPQVLTKVMFTLLDGLMKKARKRAPAALWNTRDRKAAQGAPQVLGDKYSTVIG